MLCGTFVFPARETPLPYRPAGAEPKRHPRVVGPSEFQPAAMAASHTPFGSDRDGKRLVPNAGEAAVVRKIDRRDELIAGIQRRIQELEQAGNSQPSPTSCTMYTKSVLSPSQPSPA
jgi:hypothetical protein